MHCTKREWAEGENQRFPGKRNRCRKEILGKRENENRLEGVEKKGGSMLDEQAPFTVGARNSKGYQGPGEMLTRGKKRRKLRERGVKIRRQGIKT